MANGNTQIDTSLKKVVINIGDIYVSSEPVLIYTFLGSCVSACLYDPIKKIGGMNHILLPSKYEMKSYNPSAAYGINAMEILINKMLSLGTQRRNIKAKIFGGAHLIEQMSRNNSPGLKNVKFVQEYLNTENIPIAGQDIGGVFARRIHFNTGTFEVHMQKIQTESAKEVINQEKQFENNVIKKLSHRGDDMVVF